MTKGKERLARLLAVATAIDWSRDRRCPAKWKVKGWTYRCSLDHDHPPECEEESAIRRLDRAFGFDMELRPPDEGSTHVALDREGVVVALWSSRADYEEGYFG